MSENERTTWILTGCHENFEINRERGFDVAGLKERQIRKAEKFKPGDEIIFYVTGIQAFGGLVRVTSEMFEDREPIWPQGKKKKHEDYPWRVDTEPELILETEQFVPAESFLGEMEHMKKWPEEHWHLAFQGQLRPIGPEDRDLLVGRMREAAGAAVAS